MNPYESRGPELPNGCKDLIDALNLAGPAEPKHARSQGGLPDLQRHLAWLLQRPPAIRSLTVHWPGQSDFVYLVYDGSSLWTLIWTVRGKTGHERAIREIFQEAGITPTSEESGSGSSPAVRYPLPGVASKAGEIMLEVLLRGCVVPERAVLLFDLHWA
jgi:hypothetical protein